jgi:uncharacterized protein GlcG (DUF336 family)
MIRRSTGTTNKPLYVCGGIIAIGLAVAVVMSIGSKTSVAADDPNKPGAGGSTPQKGQPLDTKDISLDQAQAVIAAAVKKSQELKIAEDIAVVDAGGNLKAFVRMDNAWLGSIDIAQKKAKTARYFDMPTGEIGKKSQPGGPLYMIEISNRGLITFPGGVPIKNSSDVVIGAIGASGSTVENDDQVANAGAAAAK